jgi:hypothetical protein
LEAVVNENGQRIISLAVSFLATSLLACHRQAFRTRIRIRTMVLERCIHRSCFRNRCRCFRIRQPNHKQHR